jgi:hypothetical protein
MPPVSLPVYVRFAPKADQLCRRLKAADFDSAIHRFESWRPSQPVPSPWAISVF